MKPGRAIAVLLLAVGVVAGCARGPSPSAFLGDLSGLERAPAGAVDVDALYRKPGADLARYPRLLIDPVQIVDNPGSDFRRIHPDERERLTIFFRNAIIIAVQDRYPVVDAPGPGVLRVRAAITDLDASYAVADVGPAGEIRGMWESYGETQIEADFSDSVTGERLAAVVDRRGGAFGPNPGRVGPLGAARAAFTDWANLFRRRLDQIHGGRPSR